MARDLLNILSISKMERDSPMSAAEYVPPTRRLNVLRDAVQGCRGCELYKHATQAVFGEGPRTATVVMIGEQPGDKEDKQGRPFVGPAGGVLDGALEEAGIDRSEVYVTNAVKHFKHTLSGKRRLHKKPDARELAACFPWLEAEFEALQPEAIVCLGATAAQQLLGRSFRITKQRGVIFKTDWAPWTMATYHPSAILRAPDQRAKEEMREALVADLKQVAKRIHSHAKA